jgi:membrane protein implicated in regulation of membrane protease activity
MKKLNSKQVIAIILGIVIFVIVSLGIDYFINYLLFGTNPNSHVFGVFGWNWKVKLIVYTFNGLVVAYLTTILTPRLFPPKEKKNKS